MKVSSRLFLGRICSEFLKHVIADLQRTDWFLKPEKCRSNGENFLIMFCLAQEDPYCEVRSVSW